MPFPKYEHELRDPIHTFIRVSSDERRVIDSRAFQHSDCDRGGRSMSLDDLREAAVLARVIDHVRQKHRFCGETLLQKSAYFLKEMFGAPISAPFRIYYYGPFSFDLRDRLNSMEAFDVVRTEPHEWGVSYKVGDRYPMLERQFRKTLVQCDPAVTWVVNELAPLSVKQLEPLATALFLTRDQPKATEDALAEELHKIKPHITVREGRIAVAKVDSWLAQVGS